MRRERPLARAETLDAVFARYERRLGTFLAQMVRDRDLAEDLLQDTFHDVLKADVDLTTIENVDAWLFSIARNRGLRSLRTSRRFARAVERLGRTQPEESDAAEVIAVRDLLEQTLSPDDRALVVLRYVHGFDSGDLARIFDSSPAAVRQRLSRARARLLTAAREEGWT